MSYCNLVAFVANSFFCWKSHLTMLVVGCCPRGERDNYWERCNRQSTPLRDGHTNLFHLSNFDLVINQQQNVDDVYLLRNEIFVIKWKNRSFLNLIMIMFIMYSPVTSYKMNVSDFTNSLWEMWNEKCKIYFEWEQCWGCTNKMKKKCSQQSWGWKKICSHRRKHWFEKQTRWLKLETDGCKNKSKSVNHFKFHFIAQIQNTKNFLPSLAFKVFYLFETLIFNKATRFFKLPIQDTRFSEIEKIIFFQQICRFKENRNCDR